MRAVVLGAAAGGGFPQWNCGCPNCRLARAGDPRVTPRTQDSLAVEGARGWLVVNASPDLPRQIEATPTLHPRGPRDTPIAALVLTNGDLDHTLGLLSLRESQPLHVYATPRVWHGLVERNAVMRTLARFPGQVTFHPLAPGVTCRIAELELAVTPFAAPGKLPVHLAQLAEPHPEDNVGLRIEAGGKTLVYATAVSDVRAVEESLAPCDALLFDGTFWSSDELVAGGLSAARAEDMAHQPLSGPRGSLEALRTVRGVARRILTHVNNTNPVLVDGSPERRAAESLGWEIARDGLEVNL